jgi:uncharacterized protein
MPSQEMPSSPPNPSHLRPIALITGASSGIGLALARRFARGGFDLIITARRAPALEDLADALRKAHNVAVHVVTADLAEPAGPQRLYDQAVAIRPSLDVLVNNAGFGDCGPFVESNLARQIEMIQVNVVALLHLTRLFLPKMVDLSRGRILNVASLAGFCPGPLMSTYYATKAFVVSHSRALSCELAGTGVTVTALCPGPVPTEFNAVAGIVSAGLSSWIVVSAERVAEAGYAGCLRGRRIVVPGALPALARWVMKLAPTELVSRLVMRRNRGRKS